jgi:hypothetical protein
MYYLVRLQHYHITEEFGTVSCDDPYDHYIGDMVERTNLRYIIVDEKGFGELCDQYIPDDPYNYESVDVIYEFHHNYELKRFLACMENIKIGIGENETL